MSNLGNLYRGELTIDTPVVCIVKYKEDKVIKYGLSIRYVANEDNVFSSGKRKDNLGVFKSIKFEDFDAIVPYEDFDANADIDYYIEKYSTKI